MLTAAVGHVDDRALEDVASVQLFEHCDRFGQVDVTHAEAHGLSGQSVRLEMLHGVGSRHRYSQDGYRRGSMALASDLRPIVDRRSHGG